MSATNGFETSLLGLIFTNVAATDVGDAGGLLPSATAGSFYISLHTATLIETDTLQTSGEAAYTGYARQAVARSAAAWTVTGNTCDNDNIILYPECTASSALVTDFGIGNLVSGAGVLKMFGALGSSLNITAGIIPQFAAGALDITLD